MAARRTAHPHWPKPPAATWIAPIVALITLLGIALGVVLLNSVTRRRIDFDDGTVWIASQAERSIARFNVRAQQTEVTLPATQSQFNVLQSGNRTALLDGSRIAGIDAATLTATDGRSPLGNAEVGDAAVGGNTIALLNTATGEVWAEEMDAINRFGTDSKPAMQLGSGGLIAIDHTGALYGYRPRDGMVLRMSKPANDMQELGSLSRNAQQPADAFTVVNGMPVIASGSEVIWLSGRITIDAQPPLVLQQPPADNKQADWVALATPSAIVGVELRHEISTRFAMPNEEAIDNASVPENVSGNNTAATNETAVVRPVSNNGCVHMAWARPANNYAKLCSAEAVGKLLAVNGSGEADEGNEDSASDKQDDRSGQDAGSSLLSLSQVSSTAKLEFQVNHRQVVLNDTTNGTVWVPDQSLDAITPQWNLAQPERDANSGGSTQVANTETTFADSCSPESGQIKAVDDDFAARVATSRILDVLRNDEQTDCSVLRITHIDALTDTAATVTPIHHGRYLQLDASQVSSPALLRYRYEISDGRGRTSSATITVKLHERNDNSAPRQTDVPPEFNIEQGAIRTLNALGEFNDPEGDEITLISASVLSAGGSQGGGASGGTASGANRLAVSTRADGQLTVSTGPMASGRIGISVTVSDGQATGTGTIYMVVHQADTLPAALDPVIANTSPHTAVTLDLTPYVHRTSAQPARLTALEAPPGINATAHAGTLSVTITATTPGSMYMPYTITQGAIDATGLVRIDVEMPSDRDRTPLLANDVAILNANGTAIVEPLLNDVDPLGGVLALTAATIAEASDGADPGLEFGIVDHHRVYLTSHRAINVPIRLTYSATNAETSASATIVVQPYIAPEATTPLRADDFSATVRTGGVLTLNALDHVSHASLTEVNVSQDLVTDSANFQGMIFASGDTIRYQAPQSEGTFTATYTVTDDSGNAASGTITITVHQSDAQTKPAPAPRDVTAQVIAGNTVRIPITLTGIDPDGDDVMLSGLGNTAAQLGRIIAIDASSMTYEAYPDSQGTDTFTYAVEDWAGQRAQATIRVGVFQAQPESGVQARDDDITLRPHTKASVPVTGNDISHDGTPLRLLDHVEAQGVEDVQVRNGSLTLLTPDTAATAYVVYQISNAAEVTDTATLTVHVDPNAAIEPPTVADYHVPPSATIDKRSVEVDIAPWISNPSGTTDELSVAVHESAGDHARMVEGKETTISLDLTDRTRMVPYMVTNTTYSLVSTAFIQVPAYGVFPPTLRPKAPALTVSAGASITIAIADYVRVGGGKTVTIDSPETVSTTKSNGGSPYIDPHTLRFTAAEGYAGPASITFTATDRERNVQYRDAADADNNIDSGINTDTDTGITRGGIINTAAISLDITVIGKDVPPPVLSSATIDVAAGEPATTVSLRSLTRMPAGISENATTYAYSSPETQGDVISHVSADGTMTISASASAAPGRTVAIPVTLKYEHGSYERGTVSTDIIARITRSSRPLARLNATPITLQAGKPTTLNIFEGSYNPFPDIPLRIADITLGDASHIRVSHTDTGLVTLTPGTNTGALSSTMTVTVEDGTHAADRQVSTSIAISLIDRPSPPSLFPSASTPQDGAVTLRWTPGQANGSPITEYLVEYAGDRHGSLPCGTNTTCRIPGLTNGVAYSFTVTARNTIGWSDASNAVTGKPDRMPSAPTNVRLEGGYLSATATWERPDYRGSDPDSYTVTLHSNGIVIASQTSNSLSARFDIPASTITDGSQFTATVTAHNNLGAGPSSAMSETALVWADPDAPTVTVQQRPDTATVDVAIALENTRNAGCAQITFSGAFETILPCDATSTTFEIGEEAFGKELTLTTTLIPRQPEAKPAVVAASFTATSAIAPPEVTPPETSPPETTPPEIDPTEVTPPESELTPEDEQEPTPFTDALNKLNALNAFSGISHLSQRTARATTNPIQARSSL